MRKFPPNTFPFLQSVILSPIEWQKTHDPPLKVIEFDMVVKKVILLLKDQPNVQILGAHFQDTLIIGDLHSSLKSIQRIIKPFLEEKVDSLIFLGDYVDRAFEETDDGLLALTVILGLYICWPDRICVIRGNHENISFNEMFGFGRDLQLQYPLLRDLHCIVQLCDDVYNFLPLAAITPQRSLCVHGGIPIGLENVEEINQIPKPHSDLIRKFPQKDDLQKFYSYLLQIGCNDPSETLTTPFGPSYRGVGAHTFGIEPLIKLLTNSKCIRMVRGHESPRGAFQRLFDGKLLHIFSSEPYNNEIPVGKVLHEQKDGKTVVRDLDFNVLIILPGN